MQKLTCILMPFTFVGVMGCGPREAQDKTEGAIGHGDRLDWAKDGYSEWAMMNDSSTSVSLHFNLVERREVVAIRFTNECWLELPIRSNGDTLIMIWSPDLDTKYDFDFVKAINMHPPAIPPVAFMTLHRATDSTLRVLQVDSSIAHSINLTRSEGEIPWFPDSFKLIDGH